MAAPAAPLDLVIPHQVLRNLADRSFDKRKAGAQEIERFFRRLAEAGQNAAISKALTLLANEYACSVNSTYRKGGLTALASAAIGLGPSTGDWLGIIVPAVLKSFNDAETRVRYYACEGLFNIVKFSRGAILRYFNDIFVGICKVVSDPDVDVKNGANLLDRLLKEIVIEAEVVDVEKFIPLLRGHMTANNPYVRQLLVGWITTLDSVPDLDMLDYMPDLLDGLFEMLSDGNKEIRQQAYAALAAFLDQIAKVAPHEFNERVAFRPMVATLIAQTSREKDKFNRLTALEWLATFITLGETKLSPVYDVIVTAVLKTISDPEGEIVTEAAKTNEALMALVRATPAHLFEPVMAGIIHTAAIESRARHNKTRSASLRWVAMMLVICPDKVMAQVSDLLSSLLNNLADSEDADVLRLNVEVLVRLSVHDLSFLRSRVLPDLVQLFASNRPLLEAKGAFILRRLCLLLDARIMYLSLANILSTVANREFASLMVELLNLILLTAVEVTELRDLLRGCMAATAPAAAATTGSSAEAGSASGEATALAASSMVSIPGDTDPYDGGSVFLALYNTWCVNPVATFSLCLLAQCYSLGAALVSRFAETTISVGMLLQVDKLVQLLETPIFVHTRLHLTQPERPDHADLLRSLYGILMLLPQGSAYATLRDRLSSVTSLHIAIASQPASSSSRSSGAWTREVSHALQTFVDAQQSSRAALVSDLRFRSVLYRHVKAQSSAGDLAVLVTDDAGLPADATTAPLPGGALLGYAHPPVAPDVAPTSMHGGDAHVDGSASTTLASGVEAGGGAGVRSATIDMISPREATSPDAGFVPSDAEDEDDAASAAYEQ